MALRPEGEEGGPDVAKLHCQFMVSAIGIVLESQGGNVLALCVQLECLPLSDIIFGPFKGDAGKVGQHLVRFDAWEVLLDELVTFRLFPLADISRFLNVLAVDALKPKLVRIVVYIYTVVFAFPHVCCFDSFDVLCLFGILLIRQYRYVVPS